jgi:hypothetical protein
MRKLLISILAPCKVERFSGTDKNYNGIYPESFSMNPIVLILIEMRLFCAL